MNSHLKYIVLVVASLFTLYSCEEKDVEVYGNDPYLVFEMPGYGLQNTPRDSMVFSFPVKGDGLKLVLSGNRFLMIERLISS